MRQSNSGNSNKIVELCFLYDLLTFSYIKKTQIANIPINIPLKSITQVNELTNTSFCIETNEQKHTFISNHHEINHKWYQAITCAINYLQKLPLKNDIENKRLELFSTENNDSNKLSTTTTTTVTINNNNNNNNNNDNNDNNDNNNTDGLDIDKVSPSSPTQSSFAQLKRPTFNMNEWIE